MSDPFRDQQLPRGVLIGAAALIGFTIVAALAGRWGDVGTVRMPAAEAIETVELRFEDRADGGVAIYGATDGQVVDVLAPGTNGFVRGVLRGLARERKRADVGMAPPFRLTRWDDGRLSLWDPSTDRRVELDAFGPTNAGVFAGFLTAGQEPR